ncbi:hypothetical protein [Ktedonospora formicarum]|uniref:hypothetical protein n=1 Tax=Ktedonospora formicarum TaxID=2778364 RepID=UPI001C689631|nr:hypothetical protein [Ktedonospora formicarum]
MKISIRAKLVCLTVFSSSLALLLLLGTAHSASAASVKTNVPAKAAMPQPDGPGATGVIPRTQLPEVYERERIAKLAPREAELIPREEEAAKAAAKQRSYGSSYRPYSYGSTYRPYSYGSTYRPYSYGSSYRPYSYGGYSHGFMR